MKGDAEPLKELFSQRDDVTLANPYGPPALGWNQVAETMERAASHYLEGETTGFERISEYATADLAYTVEVEQFRSKGWRCQRDRDLFASRDNHIST